MVFDGSHWMKTLDDGVGGRCWMIAFLSFLHSRHNDNPITHMPLDHSSDSSFHSQGAKLFPTSLANEKMKLSQRLGSMSSGKNCMGDGRYCAQLL